MFTNEEACDSRKAMKLHVFNLTLLVVQIAFLSVLIDNSLLFFFLSLGIGLSFSALGAFGIHKRARSLIIVYAIYLAIYLFVSAGLIFGLTFGFIFSWELPKCSEATSNVTTSTPPPCDKKLQGADLTRNVLAITFDFLAMIIGAVYIRFLWVLLKKMQNNSMLEATYATRLPGAPPSYHNIHPKELHMSPLPPAYLDVRTLDEKKRSRGRTGSLPSRLYEI